MNTPYTPAPSASSSTKKSRVRRRIVWLISAAPSSTMPFSSTSGAPMPFSPKSRLMLSGCPIQAYSRANWTPPAP